ncbi:hypothetical protein AB0113_26155, partial [Klebsiella variicola]
DEAGAIEGIGANSGPGVTAKDRTLMRDRAKAGYRMEDPADPRGQRCCSQQPGQIRCRVAVDKAWLPNPESRWRFDQVAAQGLGIGQMAEHAAVR